MTITPNQIREYLAEQAHSAEQMLCELIRFQSTAGNDREIQHSLMDSFGAIGVAAELAPILESLKQDAEYTFGEVDLPYEGRANLMVRIPGSGGGRSLILNAHSDVVPATQWPEAFAPRVENGFVHGRGACDDKGSVVAIYLVLKALRHFGVALGGDLLGEIVIEEEVGGNGALAAIRGGYLADGVVVMEPTEFNIYPANRGAIWFRIGMKGIPTHMGNRHQGVNAIEKMILVVNSLLDYEKQLIAASKGHPYFLGYENPVQMNLGMIKGGEWPSMVAAGCEIEGGIGFLPNKSMASVKHDVKNLLDSHADEWVRKNYTLEWPRLHNDAFEIPIDHPLVTHFKNAAETAGVDSRVEGWNVSCDARLFKTVGEMPVLCFGPGSVKDAHSVHEKVSVADILKAAETLTVFVMDWCGAQQD